MEWLESAPASIGNRKSRKFFERFPASVLPFYTLHAKAKALVIVEEELKRLSQAKVELKAQHKGDKNKVAVAARLRKETTMTLKWIAERDGQSEQCGSNGSPPSAKESDKNRKV